MLNKTGLAWKLIKDKDREVLDKCDGNGIISNKTEDSYDLEVIVDKEEKYIGSFDTQGKAIAFGIDLGLNIIIENNKDYVLFMDKNGCVYNNKIVSIDNDTGVMKVVDEKMLENRTVHPSQIINTKEDIKLLLDQWKVRQLIEQSKQVEYEYNNRYESAVRDFEDFVRFSL